MRKADQIALDNYVHEFQGRWYICHYKDGYCFTPARAEFLALPDAPEHDTYFGSTPDHRGYNYAQPSYALKRAHKIYGHLYAEELAKQIMDEGYVDDRDKRAKHLESLTSEERQALFTKPYP